MERVISLAVAALLLGFSSVANALPNYPGLFAIQYPDANAISCDYCHDGTVKIFTHYALTLKGQNEFGQNVDRTADITSRFIEAESLDSDADKFSNFQEISAGSDPSSDLSKPVAGVLQAALDGTTSSFSIASLSGAALSSIAAQDASANDVILTEGQSFLGGLNAEFSITGSDGLGSQTVTLLFSDSAVPSEGTVLYSVDSNGTSSPLQQTIDWGFNTIGGVDITLVDGGSYDLDQVVDGTIVARIAVEHTTVGDTAGGSVISGPKGGLCLINNRGWFAILMFLLMPSLGCLLRKVKACNLG